MKGTIAWNRLIIYIGASVLLLVEFYRLALILLRFLIIAPLLLVFLQNIIQWGLLIGFGSLTIGFYRIFESSPPLLNPEDYPTLNIKNLYSTGIIIVIILIILVLLPPISIVSPEFEFIFSIIMSFIWLVFYILLSSWIYLYWKLDINMKNFDSLLQDKKKMIHFFLSIFVAIFWLLDLISLIIIQETIFNTETLNLIYIIILVLFLFNQIILFFNVRKFSFLIYG